MKIQQPLPKTVPKIPVPCSSYNELLTKKSTLRHVSFSKPKRRSSTKTPFDYWLLRDKIIVEENLDEKATGDKCCTDEWNSTISRKTVEKTVTKQLKYYDENFKEINPDFSSVRSSSSSKLVSCERYKTDDSVSEKTDVVIRLIEQNSYNRQLMQTLHFNVKQNSLFVFPKVQSPIKRHYVPRCLRFTSHKEGWLNIGSCQRIKFLSENNMAHRKRSAETEQTYERVVSWLNTSEFQKHIEDAPSATVGTEIIDSQSDVAIENSEQNREVVKKQESPVEKSSEKTLLTQDSSDALLQATVDKLKNNAMIRSFKKLTWISSWQLYSKKIESDSKPPPIPTIPEKNEVVLFSLYTLTFFLVFCLLNKCNEFTVAVLFCPY